MYSLIYFVASFSNPFKPILCDSFWFKTSSDERRVSLSAGRPTAQNITAATTKEQRRQLLLSEATTCVDAACHTVGGTKALIKVLRQHMSGIVLRDTPTATAPSMAVLAATEASETRSLVMKRPSMEVLAEAAASLPRASTIASMAAAIPTSTKAVCDYEEENSDDDNIPLSALGRKPASGATGAALIANPPTARHQKQNRLQPMSCAPTSKGYKTAARKSKRDRALTEKAKQSNQYKNG